MPGGEARRADRVDPAVERKHHRLLRRLEQRPRHHVETHVAEGRGDDVGAAVVPVLPHLGDQQLGRAAPPRSEAHTSELQSLMRISYAVYCLKKKKQTHYT